jgi:hypothetical protein
MGEAWEQACSRARLGHVIRYIGRLRPAKVRGPRKPDATVQNADWLWASFRQSQADCVYDHPPPFTLLTRSSR